ncbi:hypothetical protein GMSM_12810 [Geomonas sp. Red276]
MLKRERQMKTASRFRFLISPGGRTGPDGSFLLGFPGDFGIVPLYTKTVRYSIGDGHPRVKNAKKRQPLCGTALVCLLLLDPDQAAW